MRSAHRFHPLAEVGARRVAPLEAISQTEKVIAFCRVILATTTLAVVVADSRSPALGPHVANLVVGAYAGYSALLFLLVRRELVRQEPMGRYSVALDIAWITLVTVVTEGATSPYFLLHVFVISSVSVRWGFGPTMLVTIILAALYPAVLWAATTNGLASDALGFRRAHLFRPVYLIGLGYLIGYLGEHERRSKRKLRFMLELTATFRRRRPPGRALAGLMRRTLEHFGAERIILVVRDPESGRHLTWDLTRRPGRRPRLGLRIADDDPLPLEFARATEGFLANDLRPAMPTALCYDTHTGLIERRTVRPGLALPEGTAAQAVLAAPVLVQGTPRGHAVVIRETRRKFTRDDLEFLLLVVGQAAIGFENVRLELKTEEVAVLEERSRIARDLHDGFIQSFAAIDLRVEACKQLMQRDPARVPRALAELHQTVEGGCREVRQYMTALRVPRQPADDLRSALERLASEFAVRDHLAVHVAHPASEPSLPAATGHELAQIVREALHNAVRHGRASQAIVKVGARPSHLYLLVRDNGVGFKNASGRVDADGFLRPAAAPWSIRERAEALGGSLRVWTQAGRGAEIAVTIPAAGPSGHAAEVRRMHA